MVTQQNIKLIIYISFRQISLLFEINQEYLITIKNGNAPGQIGPYNENLTSKEYSDRSYNWFQPIFKFCSIDILYYFNVDLCLKLSYSIVDVVYSINHF